MPIAEVVAEVKPPGVAWGKGSALLPELQAEPVDWTTPAAVSWRHVVPVCPCETPEMVRLVVEALPVLSTLKSVEVPYVLVVDPIANSIVGTAKAALVLAMRENCAHGEVVPIPTFPALLTMKVVEEAVEEPMTN